MLSYFMLFNTILLSGTLIDGLGLSGENRKEKEEIQPGGLRLRKRALKKWCVHGEDVNGACVCRRGYVGIYCERKMQCLSFEIKEDGSCTACKDNYEGNYCDRIICEHGTADEFEQLCRCDKPFTGDFCDKLTTKDTYYYYNSQVAKMGPLGVFILIPMLLIYYGCEHFAKKRQIRRIEKTWCDQTNVLVDTTRIKSLLDEKS